VADAVQKNTGNIERVKTKNYNVEIDRVTGQATNVYTVISKLLKNGKEEMITAFPGMLR
jgi:phosphoribosylaminoimidazole (AIR) synthetase